MLKVNIKGILGKKYVVTSSRTPNTTIRFPANRWVARQFALDASVHGSLMPIKKLLSVLSKTVPTIKNKATPVEK